MKRFFGLGIPLLLLLCMFLPAGPASAKTIRPALTYTCTGNQHCYGIVKFVTGGYTFGGEQTESNVRGINGGNGTLNNEMWLGDNHTYGGYVYFVEAGYIYGAEYLYNGDAGCGYTGETFFWADWRPNYGFAAHCPEVVGSGDYGYNVQDTIWQDSTNPLTFHVRITPHSSAQINQKSTSNAIDPNWVQYGEELYGTSGANGPRATFIDNQHMDTATHWHYWSGSPYANIWSTISNNPPRGYWDVKPSGDSTGGIWYACTISGTTC